MLVLSPFFASLASAHTLKHFLFIMKALQLLELRNVTLSSDLCGPRVAHVTMLSTTNCGERSHS